MDNIINLHENKSAMWIVCAAIGEQHELINKMNIQSLDNDKLLVEVHFVVGGIELNFNNVIKSISNNIDDLVTKKAQAVINDKYTKIIQDINDIQDYIDRHGELFSEVYNER